MIHCIDGCITVELNNNYKTPSLYLRTSEGDEKWLEVHQCSPDISYKQTEQQAKKHFSRSRLIVVGLLSIAEALSPVGVSLERSK